MEVDNIIKELPEYFNKTIEFIKTHDIRVLYNGKNKCQIELVSNNVEIGYFSITFGDPLSLNISIEDTAEFRGKGLAKFMVACACLKMITQFPNIRSNQLIFIDSDASAGFWDNIGMVQNRNYERSRNRNLEGRGYEKYITFGNLSKWSLGVILGSSTSINYMHFGSNSEISYLKSLI